MNFINFSFQHRFFFFIMVFLYTPLIVDAVSFSGNFYSPVIQELPLPSKISSSKIHNIAFDACGNMFITTEGFLWINSGGHWHSFQFRDTPVLTINEKKGVFIASGPTLYSLIAKKDRFTLKELVYHEQGKRKIKDLLIFRNYLFIISETDISYLKEDNFRILTTISQNTNVIPAGDTLFLKENTTFKIITPDLQVIPAAKQDFSVKSVLKHPGGFLITGENPREVLLYSETLKPVRQFLKNGKRLLSMARLNSGEFAFLFDSNTVIITDDEGKILHLAENIICVESLQINEIIAKDNSIFLYGEDGILVMDYPSGVEKLTWDKFPNQSALEEDSKFDTPGYELYDGYNEIIKNAGPEYYFYNDSIILPEDPGINKPRSYFVPFVPGKYQSGLIFPEYYALSDSSFLALNLSSGLQKRYNLPPDILNAEWINMATGEERIWVYSSGKILEFRPETGEFILRDPAILPFVKIDRLVAVNDDLIVAKVISSSFYGEFMTYNVSADTFEFIHLPGFDSPYGHFEATDLDSNYFLISSDKQVYKISKAVEGSPCFNTSIFGIYTGEDTLLDGICYDFARAVIEKELNSIPRRNNDITILLGNPRFPGEILAHQYKMRKGDEWSSWKEGKLLHFHDLRAGKYRIYVRIMDPNGRISFPGELIFNVRHSFFFRGYAISIYIILALIIGFISYRRIMLKRLNVYTGEEEAKQIISPPEMNVTESKKFEFESGNKNESGQARNRWDKYEMVTVLFSDIQGFTKIAEQMNPEKLIDDLDQFFFHFDSVVEKYHIEKIKTIGDAYMAAGGIPRKNRSNPVEVVLAALEMQQYMEYMKKSRVDFWDLRIGIHTGPVIAGIVGHKKRSYDIWGDTVNTASRMESSGEAGKVNISGETHKLVKEYFICEYRGKIPVKYKGNLDMYFVLGLRPELSSNLENLPNRKFYMKMQLLRLEDLEEHIFEKLNEETPKTLHFHTAEYARHLYHYAGLLTRAENLDMEETLLVLTAALILPVGYLENYFNPESVASQYAQKILPDYYFSDKQVQHISNLILASRHIPEPTHLLEKVMVDIRHEYLGRADFIKMYKLLFLERNEYHENMEIRTWKEQQVQFLERFEYYTTGAKRLCEISFEKQIQKIREDNWNK